MFSGNGFGKKVKTGLRLLASGNVSACSRRIWQKSQEWRAGYEKGQRGLWRARLVEWRGNQVRLENCTFDVDNPVVSDRAKALLWSGRYERAERQSLQYIDRGLPVIELGANIGVVACLTNKRLLPGTPHVVVEANSQVLPTLLKNRDRNGCSFHIVPKALAYGGASAKFAQHPESLASHLSEEPQAVEVPATSLGEIQASFGIGAFTLICDIEGGEEALVLNEASLLQQHARMMIMEVHPYRWSIGKERTDRMIERIHAIGFRERWRIPNHVYCWAQ